MKKPEKIVEPYAISAVKASNLPAPLPNSPMAGVTNPRIMSGIENDRKLPNKELNVTKMRAIPPGRNCPNTTPAAMAMTTLASNDTFSFFIFPFYFEPDRSTRDAHQRAD